MQWRAQASGGAGAKWHYEGTIADPGGNHDSRFYHDFLSWFFYLFCKLFEHYSQTNFPIIKTKPFKVTKYKKVWQIFRPKWVKIKIFVIILSLLLKNENKDTHYKYT